MAQIVLLLSKFKARFDSFEPWFEQQREGKSVSLVDTMKTIFVITVQNAVNTVSISPGLPWRFLQGTAKCLRYKDMLEVSGDKARQCHVAQVNCNPL